MTFIFLVYPRILSVFEVTLRSGSNIRSAEDAHVKLLFLSCCRAVVPVRTARAYTSVESSRQALENDFLRHDMQSYCIVVPVAGCKLQRRRQSNSVKIEMADSRAAAGKVYTSSASVAMFTIPLDVAPRTTPSSTRSTVLSANSSFIADFFRLTPFSSAFWPGMLNWITRSESVLLGVKGIASFETHVEGEHPKDVSRDSFSGSKVARENKDFEDTYNTEDMLV